MLQKVGICTTFNALIMHSLHRSICVLLILLSCGLKAQYSEIHGVVTDKKDSLPAVYITVYKDGNIITAAFTDVNGKYVVPGLNAGKYDVEASSMGYQTQLVKEVVIGTNQKVELNFELLMEAVAIETVQIIRYKKPLIDKDKQALVFTAEEIENLAVRDISQIAATSVDVITQDDGGDDLNIRGQRTEGTQFVVDGIKINGKLSIPQNAIEQVEVISGGLPAMYGDNIGGVVLITTKSGGAKPFGSIESVTSSGLDGFGYNLVTGTYSGAIIPAKKDSNGMVIKKSPLSFLVTGEYRYVNDPRPSALGVWQVKEETLSDLENNPLRQGENGIGTFRNAEFITKDDLELQKANPNVDAENLSLASKIDWQVGKNISVSIGGNYNFIKRHEYIYDYVLFNSVNNPEKITHSGSAFLRFKQNINTDSIQWLSNLFYQIQADYGQSYTTNWDDSHRDNVFKYGHVGKFKTHTESLYEYEEDGEHGDGYYYKGEQDVLYEFLGGGSNPNGGNYAKQYYALYEGYPTGNYENWNQASNGGALLNGERPEHVYGLWYNTGRQFNLYSKENNQQGRITGNIAARIFENHQVNIGFELEKRERREYFMTPIGLWNTMRQLANSKNSELDLENPEFTMSGGVYTDTINYNYKYQNSEVGKGFFENIRDKLGMDYSEFFDSDFYGPEMYSLDLFSADELLQEGNGAVLMAYGYDVNGNYIKRSSFFDFFRNKDEGGAFLRRQNPFTPIYSSGYIQDKFQFNHIVFNIGLRVDRYDANQPVLKDAYTLYDAFKVKDLKNNFNLPSTMDDDAVVYVDDFNASLPTVLGFRKNNEWFDATGEKISDPAEIAQSSVSGEITPYLKNPGVKMGDENYDPNSSFEDYQPQWNFMPRISFTFNLSDKSSFYAHYDVLTQRPAAEQSVFLASQYLFLENNVGSFLTNPNLKPQTTIDYEVGYQQAINQRSAITISAYYREMKNLIQVTGINYAYPADYITYGNIDVALIKGFSMKYDLRPIQSNLSFTGGYTLQFAEGTGSSPISSANLAQQGFPDLKIMLPLDFDQRHTFKAIINYSFKPGKLYRGPDWSGYGRKILGGFTANFVTKLNSGRPYTKQSNYTPDGNVQMSEKRILDGLINGNRLPWIYTTDMRLSRRFVFGLKKESDYKIKSELYLVVTNLFDTKNIVQVYSATGNAENDGYLDAASSQSQISTQTNYESYTDLYSIKIANPQNYALPRQVRLGFTMLF